MIGKRELACLECDVCGRVYFFADVSARTVLSRARESGWECPPINQKDRFGDTCPKCQPPKGDAHTLPEGPPRGAMPAELPAGGVVDMRKVLSGILVTEVSPGLTAAEEIGRVVVRGALEGDRGMIRILTEAGGPERESEFADAAQG